VQVDSFGAVLAAFQSRFDQEVLDATVTHWATRQHESVGQHPLCVADVPYGSHERHRLDIFPVSAQGTPVVLFVHGGGFVGGDKRLFTPFYENVGYYLASHGVMTATMNYRLAPTGGWPAAAEDIEAAVEWLLGQAAFYGGSPKRIVLVGQSAGACHVASWLFDPLFAKGRRSEIRGAALLSGFYFAEAPLSPGQKAYFGGDPTVYRERSPLTHVHPLTDSILVSLAEYDPPALRKQALQMVEALRRVGVTPVVHDLVGHNHVSPLMSLGSDVDSVGQLVRRFIQRASV